MFYVYSFRCQPLNLLNEAEIEWLVDNIEDDDKIILGIVNPNPRYPDQGDMVNIWTRFKLEYNPLSYWERFEIINDFIERKKLHNKIFSIIPLPRLSVNMEKANNYLPSERVVTLSIVHNSEEEENKKIGLKNQKAEIKIIPAYEFEKNLTIISPELIFCLMAIDADEWKEFVSNNVKIYLIENNISARAKDMKRKDALKKLTEIYRQTTDDEEKSILYGILKRYLQEINQPFAPRTTDFDTYDSDINALTISVKKLYEDILNELPLLKTNAPIQYKRFSEFSKTLYEMDKKAEKGLYSKPDVFKATKKQFDNLRKEWDMRNK